jgi:small membrane protein
MIKVILIAVILIALVWGLRHRDDVGFRAGRRLMALVLAGFAIVAVLAPDLTTRLAHAMGIGRGTDLLLYGLVVTFIFTTAALYFRCRDIERRMVDIARAVALREALAAGGPPGEPAPPAPRRG